MKASAILLFILLAFAGCSSIEIVTPTEYDDRGTPIKWESIESLKDD